MDARPDFMVVSSSQQSAASLRYDPGTGVPWLIAVGEGEAARVLLDEAADFELPVMERDACMDLLRGAETGAPAPEASQELLLEIMSFFAQVRPELRKRWGIDVPDGGAS